MKINKYGVIVITSTILTIGIPLFYFIIMGIVFGNNNISNDTNIWAGFGSFFGGIVSPILSVATIIFLYFNLLDEKEIQKKYEQDNRNVESINLMIKKATEIEVIVDPLIYIQWGLIRNDKNEQFHVMINLRKHAINEGIWVVSELLDVIIKINNRIYIIDSKCFYSDYIVLKYGKIINQLIKYEYNKIFETLNAFRNIENSS